jgi:competence protein ComEA
MKKVLNIGIWLFILVILTISTFISIYLSIHSNGKLSFIEEKPVSYVLTKKVVYISGAINNPGVYEIVENERIWDLIQKAGGFKEGYDPKYVNENLNLAEILIDGMHIFIPFEEQIINTSTTKNLIDINTASLEELLALNNIGEVTAKKIIENRPYNSIEDLLNISGIGEKTFSKIKDFITI